MTTRASWIYRHYNLSELRDWDNNVIGWQAESIGLDGRTVVDKIQGSDRAAVCREARRQWGHFNFQDEAEAFTRIFRA